MNYATETEAEEHWTAMKRLPGDFMEFCDEWYNNPALEGHLASVVHAETAADWWPDFFICAKHDMKVRLGMRKLYRATAHQYVYDDRDFLGNVQNACRMVGNTKANQLEILASLTEEVGELAQEVKIARGLRKGPAGKDGVVGEAIDVINCALDLIHTELGQLDPAFLSLLIGAKCAKWVSKANENKEEE